jgi:hypothetical protein
MPYIIYSKKLEIAFNVSNLHELSQSVVPASNIQDNIHNHINVYMGTYFQ